MQRLFLKNLVEWKQKNHRKPLILYGVRQVGKTYLLREFGQNYFPHYHYLNFEKDPELHKLFEKDLEPKRIINDLALYLSQKIDIENDLVIFDEIQACPKALTSLKYFQEDMPELALASAGSLLGIYLGPVSFPVGKVDMLTLHPMSFEEFLMAVENEMTLKFFQDITLETQIPEFMHDRFWRLLKIYFIVGGLPEAVSTYCHYQNDLFTALTKVRAKQFEIINAYYADIAKHCGKENAMHIERIFRSIPIQLGKNQEGSKRYAFKDVIPGINRYSRLVGAMDWLEKARLIIKVSICHFAKVPLLAYTKENEFKLYVLDTGLLGAMSDLSPKEIYEYDYGSFKGYFAENFVAQEFLASGQTRLYSWHEKSAEIEFLRPLDSFVIPVEVKSGWITQSKSLKVFNEKYHPPYLALFSAKNLALNESKTFWRYPLYLAGRFPLK